MSRLRLAALLLPACLALAAPQAAVAQTPSPSPSARELHDDYPLVPSQETARTSAQVSPTATAEQDPSPSSRTSLQHAMVAMLMVFGFAIGFALAMRSGRLRPKDEPEYAAEPPANGLAPPAQRRAWTAEIEWGPAEAGACFCVVARPVDGGASVVVAESAQLEWPPSNAAAVAAMTAAADELEARLIAAGWQPLPRGDAWYARRFHWEPAARDPEAARPGPTDALWRQPRDSAQPMGGLR